LYGWDDVVRRSGRRGARVTGNAVAWWWTVLLRLAYLGVANVFALLRLPPMSSRDKDAEILALRHQLLVLQRQLGPDRARFTRADRALLAALLHRLPRPVLKRLHLMVTGYRAPLAPRHGRAPARPPVQAPAPRPAADRPLDPPPGAAPGPRESRVGVPPGTRRAAGARDKGRRFHRLGDPARGRDRPGSRAQLRHVG
jgi:hypothetical protein